MKWIASIVILSSSLLAAQIVGPGAQTSPVASTQFTLPLITLNPACMTLFPAIVGTPGMVTYYYWVVVTFPIGNSSPCGPFPIYTANPSLSVSNYVQLTPGAQPGGSLTFDVLRTTTPIQPFGSCNCAVATGQSGSGNINDQSNTLQSYTVSTLDPNTVTLTLTNESIGSPSASPHLILRQNGTFVCDITLGCGSGGGGVGGSGTSGTLAVWTGSTTIGNSVVKQSGSGFNSVVSIGAAQLEIAGVSNTAEIWAGNSGGTTFGIFSQQPGVGNRLASIQFPVVGGSSTFVFTADTGPSGSPPCGAQMQLGGGFKLSACTLAQIGSPPADEVYYCSDCHASTTPCSTSGGTGLGTFAFSTGSGLECPF